MRDVAYEIGAFVTPAGGAGGGLIARLWIEQFNKAKTSPGLVGVGPSNKTGASLPFQAGASPFLSVVCAAPFQLSLPCLFELTICRGAT